ncbi:DUF3054 domain-containing protein [Actinomadura sp. 21ATH]|uniref:DUF3054 domain-containing protein n=1 Tax=Actinomadura sp. 21ATH TaxID=1735444 RepID=UPI0035C26BF0
MRTGAAAALDTALVLVFVTIGRSSHDEALNPAGLATTAWPFLLALAAGWLLTRAWHRPEALLTGAGIWLATVIGGMLLRAVSDQGTAVPFIIVATLFLAAVLLGWRLITKLTRGVFPSRSGRERATRHESTPSETH